MSESTVGTRFKKIRKILDMSQEELASFLNVTKQAISNIENSKSLPSITVMAKLAKEYDINLNYLIAEIGEVVLTKDKNYKSIRDLLMEEVNKFLDERGV